MKIVKIISGGQTGADQGGLLAATQLGIATGGYAPKGYLTEVGACLWLGTIYKLQESKSLGYKDRTATNVRIADGTLILGKISPGSQLTEACCRAYSRPYLWVHDLGSGITKEWVREWLKDNKITVLNVAGNRESVNPGIQEETRQLLIDVLSDQVLAKGA